MSAEDRTLRSNSGCDRPGAVRVTASNNQETAMTTSTTPPEAETDLPPGVPKGPSKADLDQISKDQALITDEWAPAPVPPPKTEAPS
jgi:hypothetical protein